jgi:two-component system response regulator AlgR
LSNNALPLTSLSELHLLIVDDEPLARSRLSDQLQEIGLQHTWQAASARQALDLLQAQEFDVVLLDIHLPGTSGLTLARQLKNLPQPPAVVFVTAHDQHALEAFELAAFDYLTKPVRRDRLHEALQRVVLRSQIPSTGQEAQGALGPEATLLIQERGISLRLPLLEVLYFKADQKYVNVRTEKAHYLIEDSLNQLQDRWGAHFVRIHRNALVPKRLISGVHRSAQDTWELSLLKVPERLEISRRNLAEIRQLLRQG